MADDRLFDEWLDKRKSPETVVSALQRQCEIQAGEATPDEASEQVRQMCQRWHSPTADDQSDLVKTISSRLDALLLQVRRGEYQAGSHVDLFSLPIYVFDSDGSQTHFSNLVAPSVTCFNQQYRLVKRELESNRTDANIQALLAQHVKLYGVAPALLRTIIEMHAYTYLQSVLKNTPQDYWKLYFKVGGIVGNGPITTVTCYTSVKLP